MPPMAIPGRDQALEVENCNPHPALAITARESNQRKGSPVMIGIVILLVLLDVAIFAALTGWIARTKGRSVAEGVLLGALLGLVGLIIEACLSRPGQRASALADKLAREDKARRPLSYGTTTRSPLSHGGGEASRMLSDLKRDRDGEG